MEKMNNKKLKDKNNLKHDILYMKQIAEERKGRCLSDKYTDNKTKLSRMCEKKHQWFARPDGIIRGNWCPYLSQRIPLKK